MALRDNKTIKRCSINLPLRDAKAQARVVKQLGTTRGRDRNPRLQREKMNRMFQTPKHQTFYSKMLFIKGKRPLDSTFQSHVGEKCSDA